VIISPIFSSDPHAAWKHEQMLGSTSSPSTTLDSAALMIALLKDAVECFHAYFLKTSRQNERQFCEDEVWITSDDSIYPSFIH
jgi:hypothetical protein